MGDVLHSVFETGARFEIGRIAVAAARDDLVHSKSIDQRERSWQLGSERHDLDDVGKLKELIDEILFRIADEFGFKWSYRSSASHPFVDFGVAQIEKPVPVRSGFVTDV